ncbi:hypothetical protein PHLGIDRAFT_200269 [Phlebiopsis gigantea 11061_1 CR5-6]|uniref:Thioredoxin domain-containing protein n=1 Tax=Phlebiopsis gigantea (strain 11061_1 CR5-6) TaxID=745531 RepID=A0A0C3RU02_PHLG1|nr:hypothetical protein PHLGIDRAFT_200269 [Phlebiopsis gigantea 11061_1 CR5-6]
MDDRPDEKALSAAADFSILDSSGNRVNFGDIYKEKKTIVVFIRHFFCGSCMAYVSQLASVRQDALQSAETQLVVIGCGDFQPIEGYAETSGFQGPIYADPGNVLFRHFNLTSTLARTPAGEQKKSYLAGRSHLWNVLGSIGRILRNLHLLGKQGAWSQLGGEFILGPGNQCLFASRMKHTEDHVELSELMNQAGVEYP